jgi:hypothetical protein
VTEFQAGVAQEIMVNKLLVGGRVRSEIVDCE